MLDGILRDGFRVLTENADGQRIGEDAAFFENLVGGTMSGGSPGGAAWHPRLHGWILAEGG